ncbi:hypothetical protein SCLARK_001856 [Spiroplasma clarkii]|uniref:Uncharacterized protein n=1 Tax=Spiroplasma clarkii TaxID=2139 RepID=A0A1Y0L2Q8_9MOLU|nr:hypothetical protein [Spiroplasma clarkii]ARU92292.1 hypothetical protein SCLARK_001856 [Spiroplasma clarkii]ATX71601.1 hypothetical protein SCLAR_v1c13030 [Spiroplasma clarkii]
MDTKDIIYIVSGSVLILIGVILAIIKIILNRREIVDQRVTLKEAQVGGLTGIWSFTKRHFLMFSIVVCFVFGFACFMGLVA